MLVARIPAATPGRLLVAYLALRQMFSAVGLVSIGGHAQMVRPLIAPMAEAAGEEARGGIEQRSPLPYPRLTPPLPTMSASFSAKTFLSPLAQFS